jgi:Leucine-rich repeat (LRR) protein
VDPLLTEAYGFTDADLQKIECIVIIGNRFMYFTHENWLNEYGYWPGVDHFADQSYQPGNIKWYSKEDGSEIQPYKWDDLSFLELMPNVHYLNIAQAEIGSMPDLSASVWKRLEGVTIQDCTLPDLNWLKGSNLREFQIWGPQNDLDLTPLNECSGLNDLFISFEDATNIDMSGFAPKKLKTLHLNAGAFLRELRLDGLKECSELREVNLDMLPQLRSISFLEGSTGLQELHLSNVGISDLSPILNSKGNLYNFQVDDCQNLHDFSPLAECVKMLNIHLGGWREWRDVSFLYNMQGLKSVGIYSANLPNLDFIKNMNRNGEAISLQIHGKVRDWSALAEVTGYQDLNIRSDDRDFSKIAPYLEKCSIRYLTLNDFENLDFTQLPKVYIELHIQNGSGNRDLKGLPRLGMGKLILEDLQDLESLNGLETAFEDGIRPQLVVMGCPRLTDWSALENMTLNWLDLTGVYTLPDLSKTEISGMRLESMDWIEDLSILDGLDADRYYGSIELAALPATIDISPVRRLRGNILKVQPEFRELAQSIVDEGRFKQLEIEYPQGGWEPWNGEVKLKSLDELDRLPIAALKHVKNLTLAGDQIIDWDKFDLHERWDNNNRHMLIHDKETDEEIPVPTGTLTDLTRLQNLTGLEELEICEQPLTSLEGIDGMLDLREINLKCCYQLEDISQLFTLEKIQQIQVMSAPVHSIQGIQNLPLLRRLSLHQTGVTDLYPLAECDLTEAYRENGLSLEMYGGDQIDATPLESIRKFDNVQTSSDWYPEWLSHMQNAEVNRLSIDNIRDQRITDLTFFGNVKVRNLRIDSFQYLKSLHGLEGMLDDGYLEELEILGCPRLTDFSALEGKHLERLWLYGTYTVPDMTNLDIGTLRLEQLDWVTDLSILDSIPEDRKISLELAQMDQLKDLNPLKRLKAGKQINVPENLLKQAEALVRSRSFEGAAIVNEDGWGVSDSNFSLQSWEELDELPDSVLTRIESIYLAGDTLYDRNQNDINEEWNWDGQNNTRTLMLHHFETNSRMPITTGTMTDLSKLSRMTGLKELVICCQPLTSLDGIENLTKLEKVEIQQAWDLKDIGPLQGLENLQWLTLRETGADDFNLLGKMNKLREIRLYDNLKDISFLKDLDLGYAYQNGGLSLYLNTEPETDLSPLDSIREYDWLQLDGGKAEWLPHIRNAKVRHLTINDINEEFTADQLPEVTERLELHSVKKLKNLAGPEEEGVLPGMNERNGLKGSGPRTIQLDSLPALTSLKGLEGLDNLRELELCSLPKLTDWSALDGKKLDSIKVCGNMVFLPEELKQQAQQVEQWDGWWNNNADFQAESIEELQNLPDELLASIERLQIFGDGVYDWSRYGLSNQWDNKKKKEVPYLWDNETQEGTPLEPGTGIDLSFLSKMTGLKELILGAQPMSDLEAVRPLKQLNYLNVKFCENLKDISAVADMPELERLSLELSGIKSIEGIGELKKLKELNLNGTDITDLSPLNDCDFSYGEQNGGINLQLGINTKKTKDWSVLGKIRNYDWLNLNDADPKLWAEHVSGAQIKGIFINGFKNQKQFEEFLDAHPEIEQLHIQFDQQITDLTKVLELKNLRYLRVSNNMKKAIKSLEGKEYSFQLQID